MDAWPIAVCCVLLRQSFITMLGLELCGCGGVAEASANA
jgi:hypothetical protein